MPAAARLTIALDPAVSARLKALAGLGGKDPAELAAAAVAGFVEAESAQIAEIEAALREAGVGDFATDAEVAAASARRRSRTLFTDELGREFSERRSEELYDALHSTYSDLLTRTLPSIALPEDAVSATDHAKFCCVLCKQALLHRALYLFDASIRNLLSNNIYATTICIRGHYETTASMGHVYKRILSLLKGNLRLDKFHETLAKQILGSRDVVRDSSANQRHDYD